MNFKALRFFNNLFKTKFKKLLHLSFMRALLLIVLWCYGSYKLSAQINFESVDPSILIDLNWNNKPSHDIYKDWNNHVLNPYPGIQSYLGDTITLKLISDSSCSFSKPCAGQITSGFGWRSGSAHVGIDLDLETGDTVVSAFDGVVRMAEWITGYGNCVVIRHFNGLESLYGHLSKILVIPGQHINSGNFIGLGGNTGYSFGSHLHFELRILGRPIDARDFIDFNSGNLKDPFLKLSKIEFEKRYGTSAIRKKIIKSSFKKRKKRKRKKTSTIRSRKQTLLQKSKTIVKSKSRSNSNKQETTVVKKSKSKTLASKKSKKVKSSSKKSVKTSK